MKNCMRVAKRVTAILLVLVMCVTMLPVMSAKAAEASGFNARPNYHISGKYAYTISPIPRPEINGDKLSKQTGLYYDVLLDIQVDTTTNKATISLDRDLHNSKDELIKFIRYLADNYPNSAPTNYSAEILTSAYNRTLPKLQANLHGELTADVDVKSKNSYGTDYLYLTLKNMQWTTDPFIWYLDEEGDSYNDIETGKDNTELSLSSKDPNNYTSDNWTASFSNGGPSSIFYLSNKTFEMGVDNFDFLNMINSFYFKGYRYTKDKPAFRTTAWTAMSHKYFRMLLDGVSPSWKAHLISICDEEFKGYCAGIASVSGLLYTGELQHSQFEENVDKTYDMKPPYLNQTLQDAIVYYYLAHNAFITDREFKSNLVSDDAFGLELLGVLKNKLPDSPVMLSLECEKACHAILAYKYVTTKNGYTYIYFYNPNTKSADNLKIYDTGKIEFMTTGMTKYKIYGYASMDAAYKTVADFKETLQPIKFRTDDKTALIRVRGTDNITIYSGPKLTDYRFAQFADGARRAGNLDAKILGYTNPLNVKPVECYFLAKYTDGDFLSVNVDDDSEASVEIIMDYGSGNMTVFAEKVNSGTKVGIDTANNKPTASIENEQDTPFRISVVDDKTICDKPAVAVEGNGKGVMLTPEEDGVEIEVLDDKEIDVITTDINDVPEDPENDDSSVVYQGVQVEETVCDGGGKKRVFVYKGNGTGNKLFNNDGTGIGTTPKDPEPPKEYKVCCIKYDGNGAEKNSMSDQYFMLYDGAMLKENNYEKKGYHLKEWNTEADGSGDSYEAESEAAAVMKGVEGTVTLYAQWEKNTFTVSYDGNEADNADEVMEDQNFVYGVEQPLRKNIYLREGFVFAGWTKYKTLADSVTPYDDESDGSKITTNHNAAITLYAKWVASHQHVAADTWSKDADYHWHECTVYTNCTKLNKEKHAYGNWVIDREATVSAQGSKHKDCTTCGYRVTETIPKLEQDAGGEDDGGGTGDSGGDNGGNSGGSNAGGGTDDNGGSGGSSSTGGDTGNTDNGGNTSDNGNTGNGGNAGDTGNTGSTGDTGNTGAEDSKYVDNAKPVASNDGSKVTTTSNGDAAISEVKKTNSKSVTVSKTTTVDGVKYNVTTINANAFKNAAKAKTVTLPDTITKIKANAFASSKIETVKITIKKGGKLTIDKKAFKKSKVKKVQVFMNKKATKKEQNAVINALKKAGIKVKNIKLKLK